MYSVHLLARCVLRNQKCLREVTFWGLGTLKKICIYLNEWQMLFAFCHLALERLLRNGLLPGKPVILYWSRRRGKDRSVLTAARGISIVSLEENTAILIKISNARKLFTAALSTAAKFGDNLPTGAQGAGETGGGG